MAGSQAVALAAVSISLGPLGHGRSKWGFVVLAPGRVVRALP